MNFQVGDKVVCVDDSYYPRTIYNLKKGLVYCVETIRHHPAYGYPTVKLVGYPSPCYDARFGYIDWRIWRFRKVSEVGHPAVEISVKESSRA